MTPIKIFLSNLFREQVPEKDRADLTADFRQYKEGGALPDTFGRDAPYTYTAARRYVDLRHIHYRPKSNPFPVRKLQFRRTAGLVLIYCAGYTNQNCYLLIAAINHWNPKEPDVIKGTDRDRGIMALIEGIAEDFREQF